MASSITTDAVRAPFPAEAAQPATRLPNPLAIAGVSLIVLLCAHILLPHWGIRGLAGAFTCYALVGVTLPLVGLAAAVDDRRRPFASTIDFGQTLPSILALFAGGVYVIAQHSVLPLCCGIVAAIASVSVGLWNTESNWCERRRRLLLSISTTAVFSAGALLLVYPSGLPNGSAGIWLCLVAIPTPLLGIFGATVAISPTQASQSKAVTNWLVTALFIAVSVCYAFSSYSLGWWVATHHWGVYVRPAQMVRDGGWLLWDVPSQYGFGCIATIAALPFSSVWSSLHFLTGLLQSAAALLIYVTLSAALGGGASRRYFAAIVVFGAIFLARLCLRPTRCSG